MSEPTARAELDALPQRHSNAGTVHAIELGGHAISAGIVAEGAAAAYGIGGMAALRCFAGRVFLPLGAAMAGAKIAEMVHADDALLSVATFFGATKQATPGPEPAHREHKTSHSYAFGGVIAGLLAAVAVGAAVALVVGTGGLLAPLVIAAAAGFAGAAVAGAGAKMANVNGVIKTGSPNVYFEGKQVARVTDLVECKDHSAPLQPIIEGSETIFINNLPLARIGHKVACNAVVQEGCKTIRADNTTVSYGKPDSEFSVGQQLIMSGVEVLGMRSASRKGGLLDSLLRKLFGEPVDAATGDYASYRTDFEYPGVLPLRLTRTYPGKDHVEGLLGRRWICNWSQRLVYEEDGQSVVLEDIEGQRLVFGLSGDRLDSIHLKAPYYHLTGSRQQARLFDSRSQETLVFSAEDGISHGSSPIGRLSAIEDRNGNRIDFVYECTKLRRLVHSDGAVFHVRTTPEGYLESVVLEGQGGTLVHYKYDVHGELTDTYSLYNGEFHFAYNWQGWLTHWRDSGATRVDLEYDAQGRVVATRTPEGLYDDRFVYFPAERKTEYFDATGARRTLWFNEDNLAIREEDALGYVTEHTWDSLERKQSTTDAAGRATLFEYDEAGRLTGETDWVGRSTRYAYDDWGLLTDVEYPGGNKSSWKYDERGNVAAETRPDGSVIIYTSDARGQLVSEKGPGGETRHWEYTRDGRLKAWKDELGNRTFVEQDAWKRPIAVRNAEGNTTRYEYHWGEENPRAALSRMVRPDGGEQQFRYDKEGMLVQRIGAEGQVTGSRYGAFDLLREATDAAGRPTSLRYDGAARLTQVTNALGQNWVYTYDAVGRLAAETDWAKRTIRYTRDATGRVLVRRLPDGVEQRFDWDERDRITEVLTPTVRIEYAYDDSDRLTRAATYRVSEEQEESEIRLVYNERGQLAEEIQTGAAIRYRYDEAGRCVGRASPSGETLFSFDARGMLSTLESNGQGLSFEHNALGLEVKRKANVPQAQTAFTLHQSYDPCGRLAGQSGAVSRGYEWDKSGRLVGVQDHARGSVNYRYDPRDQVLAVSRGANRHNGPANETYQYDALMNLAQSNGAVHAYESGSVKRAGSDRAYDYDARGRVIRKTEMRHGFRPRTWNYEWDDLDRLVEVRTEKGSWRYRYDAFGRRIRKHSEASEVQYVWQGACLAEESQGSGQTVDRWHFEPGTFRPLAKETVVEGQGKFYPIVADQLGTPKEMFSIEGECLWRAEHALWGKISITLNTGGGRQATEAEVTCSLRFPGQWEDKESGLYYNFHRYYDPESGQYLSRDPIGLDGGTRVYGYVHNPLVWVDPLGLECKATDLPVTRQGTKEWKQAVEDIRKGGKVNVRVESATEAKQLLKESRGNMNRYKRYPESGNYNKGYEMHPNESHTVNAPHNDLPHIKWKDWHSDAGGSGHIFFHKPN